MVYESQISFTLDTICPWTYLAKKRFGVKSILACGLADNGPCHVRLDEALRRFRSSPASRDVEFTIKYFPFQLYPEASKEGEDKYEWYKKEKYNNSEEQMQKYTTLMTAYGVGSGIDFDFHGTIANTMDAHRLIQHYQESLGLEAANKIVNSLYTQYFTQRAHPSSTSTLVKAALAAGVPEEEAKAFIEDEYEALQETKMLIREQAGNGIDSVPYVVLEGKRRDFTIEGAREVEEYVKELEKVAKECK